MAITAHVRLKDMLCKLFHTKPPGTKQLWGIGRVAGKCQLHESDCNGFLRQQIDYGGVSPTHSHRLSFSCSLYLKGRRGMTQKRESGEEESEAAAGHCWVAFGAQLQELESFNLSLQGEVCVKILGH